MIHPRSSCPPRPGYRDGETGTPPPLTHGVHRPGDIELDEEVLIVQEGEVTLLLNDTAHVAPAGSAAGRTPTRTADDAAEERHSCQMTYRTP